MKYLLISIVFLFIPGLCFSAADYQLELELLPQQQRLRGTAHIGSSALSPPVRLALTDRCSVDRVSQQDKEVVYRHQHGQLQIETASEEMLTIEYRCTFNDKVTENPIHNEDPSYGISATISEAGIYLSSGVDWYPRLPGKTLVYQISVAAPAGIEAVTSGKRIGHKTNDQRTSSSWLIDYPLRGITLSAGEYQIFTDTTGAVPIYAYFYSASSALAAGYLEESRNYLRLYEELFGPYPFHKFAVVENFFPTGYGLPSWTLLGSSVIKLPFIVKTSLGHEIAHSWWGIGVQVDYSQGNWAEGLTTYVADYLYQERSSTAEARDYRLKILRDYASLVNDDNSFAIKRFSSRFDKASQAIGYGKTAMLFHMLREKIGDTAFWSSLKTIAAEKMFSTVGWTDFSAAFSAASGMNLESFMEPWLTGTEGPSLSFQDVKTVENESGWLVSGKLLQGSVAYPLNIELALETASETRGFVVEMTEQVQAFDILLPSPPLTLTADPEANLFRILAAEEIPSTVNSIRGSQKLLALQMEKNVPTTEAIQTLLGALRKSDLKINKLSEVNRSELRQHDLLIFGEAEQLTPTLADRSAEKIEENNEGSLFIVQRNPFNEQKSAAWFISNSSQAAIVARKIPHYGKYSFLEFDGAENRQKEILAAEGSPLKFKF